MRIQKLTNILNLIKIANFTQGENTQIFADNFPNLENNKEWADHFYAIFNTWKEYDSYRALLNSFDNSENLKNFIIKCEEALGRITPKITRLGLPEAVALQYIHKFHPELLNGNGELLTGNEEFLTRLDGIQDSASFFSLMRGEKKKDEIPPEFEGTNFKNFDKETREWMLKVFADKTEAHSAQDIVSMAEAFKRSGDKLQKKVWEFGSYSAAQKYLDENSGSSEAAYLESIRIPAQEGNMSKIIYEDERWKVVLIGSTIAGQFWRAETGADPNMCIGTLSNNLFASYSVRGGVDPYFIIDKQDRQGSNPMRMFTISTKRSGDGSVEISEEQSTMTDANNRGIDLQKIQGYLGSDFQEIKNVILNDARSRKETLGKQNADEANGLIQNKETALQNISQIKKLIPEFIANGKKEELLALDVEGVTRGVAESLARSGNEEFFKREFDKAYPDLVRDIAEYWSKQKIYNFFKYFDKIQPALAKGDVDRLVRPAAKLHAEKSHYFFEHFDKFQHILTEDDMNDFVRAAVDRYAGGFLRYFNKFQSVLIERYKNEFVRAAAKALAEEYPYDFFQYFDIFRSVLKQKDMKKFVRLAAKWLAEKDYKYFFESFDKIGPALTEDNKNEFVLPAAKRLLAAQPHFFFQNFPKFQTVLTQKDMDEFVRPAAEMLAKDHSGYFVRNFHIFQTALGPEEANRLKGIAEGFAVAKQKTASSKSRRFNKIARYLRLAKIS